MRVLAIDPGPEMSAFLVWEPRSPLGDGPRGVIEYGKWKNIQLLEHIDDIAVWGMSCVIERIESYGMAVGREVFETCFWTGRFMERWNIMLAQESPAILLPRRDVKSHLCHDQKAKDSNVRQSLVDRFGGKEKAVGKKANPGPLYGVKGDVWSALAIAITFADKRIEEEQQRRSA